MTFYEEVFKVFLSKIQDPFYAEDLSNDIFEEDLTLLLNSAIANFDYPKIDLKAKNDYAQMFTNNLGIEEIEILASLMAYEWVKRQIRNLDLLSQTMTTKEFNTFSQANHLNALSLMERTFFKEIKEMKIRYSIKENNRPGFDRLGGTSL